MTVTRLRPVRIALLTAASVLAIMALGPATASATHLTRATKACEPQNPTTGTFNCILTIVVNQTNFGQPVTVDISPSGVDARFDSAIAGGSCPQATASVTTDSRVRISPPSGGSFANCTIVLQETLRAETFGSVCQAVNTSGHFPTLVACAELQPPPLPTTKEQCASGGFKQFGVFKNRGDCVSFVATDGKNEPGKNLPTP